MEKDQGVKIVNPRHEVSDSVVKELIESEKKQRKKRFTSVLLAAVVGIVVLAIGLFVLVNVYRSQQVKREFQAILNEAMNQKNLEKRQNMLQNFIDTNPDSEYSPIAKAKVLEVQDVIAKRDYNITLRNIENLPVDRDYKQNAEDLYNKYLDAHPDGKYADIIRKKVSEIQIHLDEAASTKLKEIAKLDYYERIAAYKEYLNEYPKGKHREAVKRLISEMVKETCPSSRKKRRRKAVISRLSGRYMLNIWKQIQIPTQKVS